MNTLRPYNTIVSDYSMFRAAMAIREWLWEISGYIRRLNEDPNPYYGVIADGLTIIEYYGSPSCLGTPFGKWACTGGGCQKAGWFDQAKERLGLVLLIPQIDDEQGTHGPVWGITKDLEGNLLPTARLPKFGDPFMTVEERIAELRAAGVNNHSPGVVDWVYPSGWSERAVADDVYYQHSKFKWSQVKANIGFVSWDDRVDPDWELVPLYTHKDQASNAEKMGHNGWASADDRKVFSMVDNQKVPVLTVVCRFDGSVEHPKEWHYVCDAILGRDNARPTADQLLLVEKLLAPREIFVPQSYKSSVGLRS